MTQKSNLERKPGRTVWILCDLAVNPKASIRIAGNPEIVKYKNRSAVAFNGSSDAIFLDAMPLEGLNQFTVEAIFNPWSGGSFEQRFLHCGEVSGDRLLLETRSTPAGWYFDAFISAGDQQKTLIDPSLLHPHDQWFHVAYVIDNGKLETFINGIKELEDHIDLVPIQGGKTSIGVRQNEISWFRGAIYKIKFASKALKPMNFMRL